MKIWKRLTAGLLGLTLAASLTGAAFAAESSAKQEPEKPAGQFSQWFPRLGADPAAPEVSEAVLAGMGTVIQQSKTANGVTAALNGAIWDGDTLRMSLVLKAPNIPKEVEAGTNLYTEECTLTMPEDAWKEYVRKDEASFGGLSKELLEKSIQARLDMGQADYWNHICLLDFCLLSREKDTLTFEASMSLADYLKQPELTLRLENIATYKDGKGDRVTWHDGKRTGPGPDATILKGPIEFTFQLEHIVPPASYTGDVQVACEDIPLRFTGFEIGAFDMKFDYEVQAPVNPIQVTRPEGAPPAPESDPNKLDNKSLSKALHHAVQGLWTKDGRYVDCSQLGGGISLITSQDGTRAYGNVGSGYPYPIDPAAVTAVNLGGTRVELSGLKPSAE